MSFAVTKRKCRCGHAAKGPYEGTVSSVISNSCSWRHQPSAVKMVWRIVGLTDLDVPDADAELAVGLLGQVADRVDGRLRPDTRDVRPRR